MKHLFLINPNAGKGKAFETVMPKIKEATAERNMDYKVYVSKSSQDTHDYCKKIGESGEKTRIYACGGDGTIYDIVNAIYGYNNVEFAAVPLGSGNDFIRIFGTKEQFMDIGAQIDGTAIKIDAIKCGDRRISKNFHGLRVNRLTRLHFSIVLNQKHLTASQLQLTTESR